MRIAIAQAPGTPLSRWRQTLELIDNLIEDAARQHADSVLLPECVWPAYDIGSPRAYHEARSAGMPSPADFLQHLQAAAQRHHIGICAGYIEEQDDILLNAASLIDADGHLLGTHHKCFLWDFDHEYFRPGNVIRPITSPAGCIGIMICADARLPEIPATLVARGATLILQPTAWVNIGTPPQLRNPQPEYLIPARAREFGVPIASTSKWGQEGNTTFVGSSLICDATGNVVAQCRTTETKVVSAEVALATPHRPAIPGEQHGAVLAPTPPRKPRRDVPRFWLLPVPPTSLNNDSGPDLAYPAVEGEPLVAFSLGCGADVRAAPPTGAHNDRLTLAAPTNEPIEFRGGRLAAVDARDVTSFARIRALALDGVHLVLVVGERVPTLLLRTRACENRIYVASAHPDGWSLVDPRGDILATGTWPSSAVNARPHPVDLSLAADKEFAARTDMMADRCPVQYEF